MNNKFFKILFFCFILQNILFAPSFAESIIPEAGTINTHDLDTLKKFEAEKQVEQDFKKFQDTKEDKQESKKPKKKRKKKT